LDKKKITSALFAHREISNETPGIPKIETTTDASAARRLKSLFSIVAKKYNFSQLQSNITSFA
jgi:hypothetical protein